MKFKKYPDEAGEWRWTLLATGNNKTLADSGEGYKNEADCDHAINLIRLMVPKAPVERHVRTLAGIGLAYKR